MRHFVRPSTLFTVHSAFKPFRRTPAHFTTVLRTAAPPAARESQGRISGMRVLAFDLRRSVVACVFTAACVASSVGAAQSSRGVPDTMAQRMQACTPCHGKEGRSSPVGYLPRIAGKPAGYLTNQLMNFRDGRRYNAAMTHLVEYLSDDYLREIGEHFSALDLPYPTPALPSERESVLRRGETLATRGDPARRVPACTQCHGYELTGALPAIPGLLGLPADYVIGQLGAWKSGNRRTAQPDCMEAIARQLPAEDVRAVAVWLSSRAVPPGARPAPHPDLPLPIECGSGVR
jgi:cytochrome c553